MGLSELNDEQRAALLQYAKDHGAQWKRQLRIDWMRAGSKWHGPWAPLQQIRNTLGPAWLDKVTIDLGSN